MSRKTKKSKIAPKAAAPDRSEFLALVARVDNAGQELILDALRAFVSVPDLDEDTYDSAWLSEVAVRHPELIQRAENAAARRNVSRLQALRMSVEVR